jgi:hypothetical protein
MNKLILSTVLATMIVSHASATTVLYPEKYCAEILSSNYNRSGGGVASFNVFEILCKDETGNYRAFVTSWKTKAPGWSSYERIFYDEVIELNPYNGEVLQAQ